MSLEDLASDLMNDLGPAIGQVIRVLRVIQAVSCLLAKFLPVLEGMYYANQQGTSMEGNSTS